MRGLADDERPDLRAFAAMAGGVSMTVPAVHGARPVGARMTLGAVQRGVVQAPARVLLYGPEGIGKTTFGARAPAPIFLGTEDGFGLLDVARFPEPRSWAEVLEALRALETEDHAYRTLALDSLDWLEPLCWRHVCGAAGKPDIEAFGYGKGYVAALDEWRVLLAALERVRRAKRMHVVLLAHAHVKPYRNPEGDDYDRFTLKLHEKAAGVLKEWCDAVLFANFGGVVVDKAQNGKGKAIGTPVRQLYTTRRASFDAKNRYGLPEVLPLEWAAFEAAALAPKDPAELRARVEELCGQVPSDIAAKARAYAAERATDVPRLVELINRLRAHADAHVSATSTNPTE